MPAVFLAIPINRSIHPMVLDTIVQQIGAGISHIHTESDSSMFIDKKRNKCVDRFLESDCTHLLFVDSDTVITQDALRCLLADDKPVVSAVIYRKSNGYTPCFGYWEAETSLYRIPLPFEYNKLLKVDIVGTGFLLIKREVFEKVKSPWFQCHEEGNAWEDVSFCLKCRDAGVSVYVDTGVHLGHLSDNFVITNETYEMMMFWKIVKQISAAGRLDRFREFLVKEMQSEIADIPTDPNKAIAFAAQKGYGYNIDERLREAYVDYVKNVSTPVWSISWQLVVYLEKLVRALQPKRVLDLGSGFSSYLLRRFNTEVTSVDTDLGWLQKTHDFLQHKQVTTEGLYLLKDFQFIGDYDLILHDLGRVEIDRLPLFKEIRQHCNGVAIFDDMHTATYQREVKEFFKDDIIMDLEDDTFDALDRKSVV